MAFDFTWRNEFQRTVSVHINGYLVLDGTAVTLSDGGWIALNHSRVNLVPMMSVFDLSTDPPIELPTQDGGRTVALHLSCESLGVFESGGIDGAERFRPGDRSRETSPQRP